MHVDFLRADDAVELKSMLNKLDKNSYRVITIYREGGSMYAWIEFKDLEIKEIKHNKKGH